MTLYIYVENNVWKLITEITSENEEFNPKEVFIPENGVSDLIEYAKEQGAEEGDNIKEFFSSVNNDSYFVYTDEEWTVLAAGEYFAYKTTEIPEKFIEGL
jgi:hypothetical protein